MPRAKGQPRSNRKARLRNRPCAMRDHRPSQAEHQKDHAAREQNCEKVGEKEERGARGCIQLTLLKRNADHAQRRHERDGDGNAAQRLGDFGAGGNEGAGRTRPQRREERVEAGWMREVISASLIRRSSRRARPTPTGRRRESRKRHLHRRGRRRATLVARTPSRQRLLSPSSAPSGRTTRQLHIRRYGIGETQGGDDGRKQSKAKISSGGCAMRSTKEGLMR